MWAKVLMTLVTIVLLGLGTIYLLGIAERGRWERYAATLREAGEPLTFKEIEARRADVPDERNSALVIEAVLEKFPPDDDPPPYVLVLGVDAPEVDFFKGIPRYAIEDSRVFLEKHQPLLDALRPVLKMPTGRFSVAHAKNPLNTLLPNLHGSRTAARLARLDTILRLVDGDAGGAVDATILQRHIAGSLNEIPSFLSHLVQRACDRVALESVEDVLHAVAAPEADLVRLRDAIAARRLGNPMLWSMWSERAFAVETLDLCASGELTVAELRDLGFTGPSILGMNPLPEFTVRKNQILAVELLTRLVDAGEDLHAMREAAVQSNTEVDRLSDSYFLTKTIVWGPERAVYLQIKHNAILDCTLAGIAAERFRLANRRWPASLDQLVPTYLDQVPADPFAEGQPLKLATTDQGIVIYSIGDDGIDDGGQVAAEQNQRVGPDLGFRLLDPEHRGVVITDEPRPEEGD